MNTKTTRTPIKYSQKPGFSPGQQLSYRHFTKETGFLDRRLAASSNLIWA
ncbi:MAG: hypothetical protein RID09_30380 [Coleofasciculus sp. G1-WW12-02]